MFRVFFCSSECSLNIFLLTLIQLKILNYKAIFPVEKIALLLFLKEVAYL